MLTLCNRHLKVLVDSETGILEIKKYDERLPWRIELERSARVGVREGAVTSEYPIKLEYLTQNCLSRTRVQWLGEIRKAGIVLEIALEEGEIVFSISATCSGVNTIVSAVWPGKVKASAVERAAFWSTQYEGCIFKADGKAFEANNLWYRATMRMGGLTAGKDTLTLIVETPYDARSRFMDNGYEEISLETTFLPFKNELGYVRRLRLAPVDESGYVGAVDVFREYAKKHGLWKSFAEKQSERPELRKLVGAFIANAGYLQDNGANQLAAMEFMKSAGFEHGYLFSPKLLTFDDATWMRSMRSPLNRLSDKVILEIQKLGYICAPFLQIELVSDSFGEALLKHDTDGNPVEGWQIGNDMFYEIDKWRIPSMLPEIEPELSACNGIHFDTLTDQSRCDDVASRLQILEYYIRRGKIIGSECMKDWSIPFQDYGTTKSLSAYSYAPVGNEKRCWSLPLSELAYHDCISRSHWEHHAINDSRQVEHHSMGPGYWPWGVMLNNYLTASPPVLFPEGKMYVYKTREETASDGQKSQIYDFTRTELYSKRHTEQDLLVQLPDALKLCRLNMRHGVARMEKHRYISDKVPDVQESEFDSGLHVIVNYGNEPFTLPDGRTISAKSSIIKE